MGKSPRLQYLDGMRGMAVLIMLQGHAFHAWMRDDLRGSFLYQLSQTLGGFPAPLFLFLTGFSLVLMLRRSEQAAPSRAERWSVILRRSGYIFLVALLFRFQQWAVYWPKSSAADLLRADILNTIAVALVAAGAVTLLFDGRRRLIALAICAAATAMVTPLVWPRAAAIAPAFVADYLNGSADGSNFPVFPWISYAFTGALVGLLAAGKDTLQTDRLMKRLTWLAVALLVAAKLFDSQPFSYYQPYNYWLTSPNLVANRTAIALLFLAGCYAWERRGGVRGAGWVGRLGQASLVVYWVHIEVVYGPLFSSLQHSLDPLRMVLAVAVLLAAMLALAVAKARWSWRRRDGFDPLPSANPALANVPCAE